MIVTIVHVWVKSEFIDEFREATRLNHEQSVRESGNFRFDILQDETNPSKFVLYEAYATEGDILAHRETPHYKQWRDTVAPWMEQPRQAIRHKLLFPTQ